MKPKVLVGGFSAYSQVVDWAKMREIADEVGAYLFVDVHSWFDCSWSLSKSIATC